MRKIIILVGSILISSVGYNQNWGTFGPGFTFGAIEDLHIYANELYACGGVQASGTTVVNGIAKWNGVSWEPLINGTNFGGPSTMATYNGELIVAGNFNSISGVPGAENIAKWNGNAWSNLNNGVSGGFVKCMAVYNGDLYIGGNFQSVDGNPFIDIARWDGVNWHSVCSLSSGLSQLMCMTVWNNELYIGGYFSSLNGSPMSNIAKFNGSNWTNVGGGLGGDVFCLISDSVTNRLYASGNISSLNNGATLCPSNVAYWDGSVWYPVGNGPQMTPRTLTFFQNELYVGFGSIQTNSSGDSLKFLAKWDGQDWSSVGGGMNCRVFTFLPLNNELIIGGCFTTAGDSIVNLIAVWSDPLTALNSTLQSDNVIKIIPNPTNKFATVKLPDSYQYHLPLIFNLNNTNGKNVFKQKIHNLEFVVSVELLTSGIYIYVIGNDHQEFSKGKIMIE